MKTIEPINRVVGSVADVPWTIRLRDGRTVAVEIPRKWTGTDRDGTITFLPPAVRFIDRIGALFSVIDSAPSPGYIATLRGALGMTQLQMGQIIGVDKLTISRWERGELRPGSASLKAIEKLRRQAVRRGVALAA